MAVVHVLLTTSKWQMPDAYTFIVRSHVQKCPGHTSCQRRRRMWSSHCTELCARKKKCLPWSCRPLGWIFAEWKSKLRCCVQPEAGAGVGNQGKISERGRGGIKRASVSCQSATFSKQVELLSRPVQSLTGSSFNSALITVFFPSWTCCEGDLFVSFLGIFDLKARRRRPSAGATRSFGPHLFSLILKKRTSF